MALRLKANRRYPELPVVIDDARNHTLVLSAVREALYISQRRTGDLMNSHIRVEDLVDLGLITIEGNTNAVVGADLSEIAAIGDLSGAATGDILRFNGVEWVNDQLAPADITQLMVTQHESALTIDWSQLTSVKAVNTTHSLTGGGALTVDRTLSLLNDQSSPGAYMMYGTNASGVKGWYLQPGGSGGVITDHGLLLGLGDDDHPQYHNNARGDARYSLISHTHVVTDVTGAAPTSRLISTQYSLTGGGSLAADRTINLVNDVASPGNNMLYGTNASGVRGWYAQSSSVTPAALTKTDDTNVTLTLGGSPTTALLQATSLTLGWSGQLSVARGGTGAATLTGHVSGNGTGAFTASATIPGADITGAALTKTDDTNVTLTLGGTPTTALLRAASLTLGWTGQLSVARGGTGAATLTGYVKGAGTSALTASATIPYSDLSGTPSIPVAANRTVSTTLTVQHGSASTFARSDSAPALDQSIGPTWTGAHVWKGLATRGGTVGLASVGLSAGGAPMLSLTNASAGTDAKSWDAYVDSTGIYNLVTVDQAVANSRSALTFTRSALAITAMAYGNSTDSPAHTFYGSRHYFKGTGATTSPDLTASSIVLLVQSGSTPMLQMVNSGGITNQKHMRLYLDTNALKLQFVDDAYSTVSNIFNVRRYTSGKAWWFTEYGDFADIAQGAHIFNGNVQVTNFVRAVGWAGGAGASDSAGPGAEMGYTGGSAYFVGFDRTAGTYKPVSFNGIDYTWNTSGTSRMTLNSSGTLKVTGILTSTIAEYSGTGYYFGFTTTNYGYHYIQGAAAATSYIGLVFYDGARNWTMMAHSGGTIVGVYNQGAARWAWYDDGVKFNVQYAVNVVSSRKYKRETGRPSNTARILAKLRPTLFKMLVASKDQEEIGMIAEEVHEICPWLSDGHGICYDRVAMLLLVDWQERYGNTWEEAA